MSSSKTEKILKDLISELHEFYGNPPYIHLGCDEAYDKATCYKCRKEEFVPLFVGYLCKFNNFVKERGARAIIWHDMLLNKQDPRWEKHVATGDATTATALNVIPKDIIIADWQYSWKHTTFTKFKSPQHFKEAGFDVIVCPWDRNGGIESLARITKEKELFGFLETTWHHIFSNKHYHSFFWHAGNAAWNGGGYPVSGKFTNISLQFISQISQIISNMQNSAYETSGTSKAQINKSVQK